MYPCCLSQECIHVFCTPARSLVSIGIDFPFFREESFGGVSVRLIRPLDCFMRCYPLSIGCRHTSSFLPSRHPTNGCVIARSSQPLVGLLNWRSAEDEKLLLAVSQACASFRTPRPGEGVALPHQNGGVRIGNGEPGGRELLLETAKLIHLKYVSSIPTRRVVSKYHQTAGLMIFETTVRVGIEDTHFTTSQPRVSLQQPS